MLERRNREMPACCIMAAGAWKGRSAIVIGPAVALARVEKVKPSGCYGDPERDHGSPHTFGTTAVRSRRTEGRAISGCRPAANRCTGQRTSYRGGAVPASYGNAG